ncbi:MAG TPA: MipA/OmpV family protein [Xanthobacteraceae bacterium]|nr:MipA/OmpV family protein [Xanthobacteraceae bacterium]
MRTTSLKSWIAIALAAVAVPSLAVAADLPAPAAPPSAPAAYAPPVPDWIVTIGAEGRIVPAWAGATDSKPALTGFPLFSVRKQGSPPDFPGARDSIGFSIFDIGPVKIGPAFKFIWKREAGDYRELNGLGDVDYALQAGAFAEYWPVSWLRLRGEVRQGFGGEKGVTGDLFLDAVVPVAQWTFSAGPRMTLQSTAANSPYFSITATQSANSGVAGLPILPAYRAGGGVYSYGAGTMVQYAFNQQWTVHALFEYEHLTGSVADSPLVIQRGSPDQFTYGLGATYSFSMHPWW